ncbi:MAG: MFS transporter [Fimbriimonas sp.]
MRLSPGTDDQGPKPLSGFRWTVCALIFFAVTVNYLDRQLFSLMVPFFEDELRLGPTDLALINVSFIIPYGLAMIFIGRLVDRIGIKKGLSISFVIWNVASIAHALVYSLAGFMGMRFLLGLGESAMFPTAVKTMADWFPRKERAFATGLFNGGANIGAVLAPLLGVLVATMFGWRACFLLTGGIGIIWIFFWIPMYRDPDKHPKVSESELAYIRSDQEHDAKAITFSQLFGIRQLYGLGIAKALTDAPWWFYLTWMPKFLVDQFHLSAGFMALAIPVIYIIADVGSIAGGWLSSALIKSGRSVGSARKIAMLVCAIAVTPVMTVGLLVDHAPILGIPPVYWAIACVALAAGAHQGWSCNLFTLVSDTVPSGSVAMAVGAINGFAMVGVSALQLFVGRAVQLTSSYTLPFIVAGTLYLIALAILQLFIPEVHQAPTVRRAKMPYVVAGGIATLAALGYMQYEVNKPPYLSLADYVSKRQVELHAQTPPKVGPSAKVGWMNAQWYSWVDGEGENKWELVKLDGQARPIIEKKGTAATKYEGPKTL